MLASWMPIYAQGYEEGSEALLFMEFPEVTTSTLSKLASVKAPSTMTVITEEEIRSLRPKTLMDLLDQLPGIRLNKEFFARETITFRGITSTISNDRFKLMINGHAVYEPIWGSFSDLYDISLEHVKQIEIVHGPGSALYGTNAFAGIINIITKSPAEVNGLDATVSGGSFDSVKADVLYGNGTEETEWGVYFNYYDTEGTDQDITQDGLFGTPFSIAPQTSNERVESSQVDFNFRHKDFKLYASYMDREVGSPVNQIAYLTEDGEFKNWKFGFIEMSYEWMVAEEFTIKTILSYDDVDLVDEAQQFPKGFAIPQDIDGDGDIEFWPDGAYGSFGYRSQEVRSEILFSYQASENNKLLIGLFAERVETDDFFLELEGHPLFFYNTDGLVDYSDTLNWNRPEEREIAGVFFQDEWQMNDEWYFVLGGRYDDYSDFGSTFNPRTALVWDFSGGVGGVLKLMYATAFKAPTFSQLYNQNNPSLVGNPDLDAEKLDLIEVSLSYSLFEKLQTDLSVYYSETEDLIDLSEERDFSQPLAPSFYVNRGETETSGAELDLKYAIGAFNYLYANLHYTRSEDAITGDDLPLIPEFQGILGLQLNLVPGLNWNIHLDYTGELEREAGDPREDLDATVVVDTTLDYRTETGWEFFAAVYNAFDEEVYSPTRLSNYPLADLERPGTNYRAGVSKKF
jgi:iron complex outermembrane receptor protein